MSGTTNLVLSGKMEHITHDNDPNDDGRDRAALQNLIGYIDDPMREYHNEVKKRIQEASEDIEQIAVKTRAELEKRIMELERRLKESETLRDRYRNERNDLRKILSNFSKERQQKISNDQELAFKPEIANLENAHELKEKNWAKKLKDLEDTSDDIIKGQKEKIKEMQKHIKLLELEIQSLQEHLHCSAKRPSKAMGDKLTNNNPNIADLSDKDRPTKLAERFTELYENQWTDAYEIIECHFGSEEEVIQALLGILMNVMGFCKSQAKLQLEKLHKTLTFSTHVGDKPVPDKITKQMIDMRKAVSTAASQNLYQEYIDCLLDSKDQTLRHATKIKSFVKECFETCWLMAIQDPPIVFCPMPRNRDVLNTEMYKPYTRTGRLIQFVVWPALLLHDSGPILAKGVAQGMNERHERPTGAWIDKTNKSGVLQENHEEKDDYGNGSIRYHPCFEYDYDSGITNMNKRCETPNEDRHYRSHSAGHTRPSYQQSTVTTTSAAKEASKSKLSKTVERSPTREEMKLYFRYIDRRDHVGAINCLGYAIYRKCQLREHKRHLYC